MKENINNNKQDGNHSSAMKAYVEIHNETKSFKQAMSCSEPALWKATADEEINSHMKNNTWTLMTLPVGRICIPSGWNSDSRVIADWRKNRFL